MNKDYTLFSSDLTRVHPLVLLTIALLILSIITSSLLKAASIFLLGVAVLIEAMLLWKEA